MQTLMYFLFWGTFFFLMMRFGCGTHILGHGHSRRDRRGDPDDPVKAAPQLSVEGLANSPINVEQFNEHKH